MHGDHEGALHTKGPIIEPNSPLCPYGPELLALFQAACLNSPEYVDRVRDHYAKFKAYRA